MVKAFTPTDIVSIQRPVDTENGLPSEHYTDPKVYVEKSQDRFEIYLGRARCRSDVPIPDNARPIKFLGMSLLLLRDKDCNIEVFEEHVFVVQGMQSGRYVPTFDGGRWTV